MAITAQNQPAPRRVLITGAGGFIGRHAIEPLLERGFDVHGVIHTHKSNVDQRVTWHSADLLQPDVIASLMDKVRPSHLLNFAWYMEPGKNYRSLENFKWVQVGIELLLQFQSVGGQRVVMAGSCAEYDWQYGICNELKTPLAAKSPYATAKIALYRMFESMREEMGLSAAWGRLFFAYGPYEHLDRLVPSVVTALLNNQPARCSEGTQQRDFLHVADIGNAYAALLDSDVQGAVNIGSGSAVAIRDIVNTIGVKLGKSHLIELGAQKARRHEAALVQADMRHCADTVGWAPQFSLETGLEDTILWWKNQLNSPDN